jgi:hypothetical protein
MMLNIDSDTDYCLDCHLNFHELAMMIYFSTCISHMYSTDLFCTVLHCSQNGYMTHTHAELSGTVDDTCVHPYFPSMLTGVACCVKVCQNMEIRQYRSNICGGKIVKYQLLVSLLIHDAQLRATQ